MEMCGINYYGIRHYHRQLGDYTGFNQYWLNVLLSNRKLNNQHMSKQLVAKIFPFKLFSTMRRNPLSSPVKNQISAKEFS